MIVKQKRLKFSSGTLFGIGGGAFLVLTAALMVRASFVEQTVPGCQSRYANAGLFGLERSSGELLDGASLQAKVSGSDWAVIDNVTVSRGGRDGAGAAMRIDFAPGGTFNGALMTASSGAGFAWRPNYLAAAGSACLAYSVRLPADFEFAGGGTLPGLFGSRAGPDEPAFSTRMRWLGKGQLGVQPVTPANREGRIIVADEDWLRLPRGEWIDIEQEVVLNDPGQANGRLRIWVGGEMRLDRGQIMFRQDDDVRVTGVIADTHYADKAMNWEPAPRRSQIEISPFTVRWQ